MGIKALRQAKADNEAAQAALKSEARTILAVAHDKRTTEQAARLDAIDAALTAKADELAIVTADLARAERYADDERAAGATGRVEFGADRAAARPWGPEVASTATPAEQEEARQIALGTFAQAVYRASMGQGSDPRLFAAASGAGTQVDSNLGFAVPQEVAAGIEREMYQVGELLSRVDARTISGNSIAYNVFDETSRADSSRGGGVLGYWVDEGEAPTATNMKLARIEMKLRKVGALGYMTDELMADAQGLGGELQGAFADELIFQIENKIYRGSGSNAPRGFLNASCLVSVSKETGQAAATILTENIVKMFSRRFAGQTGNYIWLYNQNIEPQLTTLSIQVGTGGVPVYMPPGGLANAPNGTILGRPAIAIEQAATLGTVGDIILANFANGYILAEKGGVRSDMSIHVRFVYDESVFRFVLRVDGQPVRQTALTPYKGGAGATQSHFIALETRS